MEVSMKLYCIVHEFDEKETGKQGFVKGEVHCFIYYDFLFHRSTASQTSWREYFYS